MENKIIKGNLIDAHLNNEVDYMFHCCNCQKNFGSGIALEVKNRIPAAYEADLASGDDMLGEFTTGGGVYNLYGQKYYGRYGSYYQEFNRQIDYNAYRRALYNALADIAGEEGDLKNVVLGFPYKIGSDRAGGDWDTVKKITEDMVSNFNGTMVWFRI